MLQLSRYEVSLLSHLSGANIFFKIAQTIILLNSCDVETEYFPCLFSSFWVPFWKFPIFGKFWVWQNYRVKKKKQTDNK